MQLSLLQAPGGSLPVKVVCFAPIKHGSADLGFNFADSSLFVVDVELAAKFQDELALETQTEEANNLPENLKYFLENGPFEVCFTVYFCLTIYI